MAEPILWANKAGASRTKLVRKYDPETGKMEVVIDPVTEQPLREKIPQTAHRGGSDYDDPQLDKRIRAYLHVLTHAGNEVRMRINMGAADVEGADFYGRERTAKMRYFGWIRVGECPIAARVAGRLQKHQIVAKDLRDAKDACEAGTCSEDRPCRHYELERDARRARQAKAQAARDATMRTEAEKLIAAQKQQTTEIVTGVATAIGDALKSALQPQPPAPPPPAPPDEPASRKKGG